MDKSLYQKICSIRKMNNSWEFYDCEGNVLRSYSDSESFTSSMNRRYRIKRTINSSNEDMSCVWFLIGEKNNISKWIQVGRTKNLTNLLSNDVKEDIKDFYSGKGKYGKLKKHYSELTFYEIDIERYIKNDEEAQSILGEMPTDKCLKQVYMVNCAAYIEGKLSFENDAELYCPSTLDGYFYSYFKNRK